jgi:Thymidylate synthase
LDLTVNQRSPDVMLGLPHDVVAWTVILHLVRREVHRLSGRQLHAGKLHFNINAGGAHVYQLNADNFVELLRRRRPKPNVEPELIMCIDNNVSMFEFAHTYGDKKKSNACGYGKDLMGVSSFDKMYPALPSPSTVNPDSSNNTEQEQHRREVFVAEYSDYHERMHIKQAG